MFGKFIQHTLQEFTYDESFMDGVTLKKYEGYSDIFLFLILKLFFYYVITIPEASPEGPTLCNVHKNTRNVIELIEDCNLVSFLFSIIFQF